TIGPNTFRNCKSLISISIPSSVTSIGSYVFKRNNSNTELTITYQGTEIEWNSITKERNWDNDAPYSMSIVYAPQS
ncbi:MAG: leucine-rich repeat protein, partial [Spirochaetales bacterium]|nr:leucine-rich repeat protein [Spirochaetales bacterium]